MNQGRVDAGESVLNSSSATETQQALYSLPQSDYNAIASGDNGYYANPGYNLVTGLGTPVANLLVADLVAYQGPGTTYAGTPVGALQNATLDSNWSSGGGTTDSFIVFNAIQVASGLGSDHGLGAAGALIAAMGGTPSHDLVTGRFEVTPMATYQTTLGMPHVSLSGNETVGVQAIDWFNECLAPGPESPVTGHTTRHVSVHQSGSGRAPWVHD